MGGQEVVMSFSAKQCFNPPTLRESLSWCCFNPADAEQFEKGNKQLGEIIPPVYVDFYQTGLATSCRGICEKLRWEQERQTQTEARSWLFRYLVAGGGGGVPRK